MGEPVAVQRQASRENRNDRERDREVREATHAPIQLLGVAHLVELFDVALHLRRSIDSFQHSVPPSSAAIVAFCASLFAGGGARKEREVPFHSHSPLPDATDCSALTNHEGRSLSGVPRATQSPVAARNQRSGPGLPCSVPPYEGGLCLQRDWAVRARTS